MYCQGFIMREVHRTYAASTASTIRGSAWRNALYVASTSSTAGASSPRHLSYVRESYAPQRLTRMQRVSSICTSLCCHGPTQLHGTIPINLEPAIIESFRKPCGGNQDCRPVYLVLYHVVVVVVTMIWAHYQKLHNLNNSS